MENILELQQVSKTFSKSKFSLENVSFNLPYGAIMGFVGENGAGKTTTISMLCGMLPTSGSRHRSLSHRGLGVGVWT